MNSWKNSQAQIPRHRKQLEKQEGMYAMFSILRNQKSLTQSKKILERPFKCTHCSLRIFFMDRESRFMRNPIAKFVGIPQGLNIAESTVARFEFITEAHMHAHKLQR